MFPFSYHCFYDFFCMCKQICSLDDVFMPSYLSCVFRKLKFLLRCNIFTLYVDTKGKKKAFLSYPNTTATALYYKNGSSQPIYFLSEASFKVLPLCYQNLSSLWLERRVLSPDLPFMLFSTSWEFIFSLTPDSLFFFLTVLMLLSNDLTLLLTVIVCPAWHNSDVSRHWVHHVKWLSSRC